MIVLFIFFVFVQSQSGDFMLEISENADENRESLEKKINFTAQLLRNVDRRTFHIEADTLKIIRKLSADEEKIEKILRNQLRMIQNQTLIKLEFILGYALLLSVIFTIFYICVVRAYRLYNIKKENPYRKSTVRRRLNFDNL